VPVELERIIEKALSKDPGSRYQHVEDMIVDLKGLSYEHSRVRTSVIPRKKVSRKLIWIPASLIVVVRGFL